MRLLTFSFLRNSNYNTAVGYRLLKRCYSSDKVQPKLDVEFVADGSDLIEFHGSWPTDEEAASLRTATRRDMRVLRDFITEEEEHSIMKELEPVFKKMRYEYDHWDNAIHGFRETEKRSWSPVNQAVMSRVVEVAFSDAEAGEPLPYQHVLDLAMAGEIKPHVDAVRFCGAVIAGISLHSAAVMRLTHSKRPELALDALLLPRSLYIMRGVARYSFTHAVLGGGGETGGTQGGTQGGTEGGTQGGTEGGTQGGSTWRGRDVPRRRRVSVITRSKPLPRDTV